MYILDKYLFHKALKQSGFQSLAALSAELGIHRNTLNYYLNGQAVISEKLERVLDRLALSPADAFVRERVTKQISHEKIVSFVDELAENFPKLTFILFGSQARGTAKKHSDYDLGAYSRKGIEHGDFLKVYSKKEELEENLPFFVDLSNLCSIEKSFLKEISNDWIFLRGSQMDWVELHKSLSK